MGAHRRRSMSKGLLGGGGGAPSKSLALACANMEMSACMLTRERAGRVRAPRMRRIPIGIDFENSESHAHVPGIGQSSHVQPSNVQPFDGGGGRLPPNGPSIRNSGAFEFWVNNNFECVLMY